MRALGLALLSVAAFIAFVAGRTQADYALSLRTLDTPNPQPMAEFGLSAALGDADGDGWNEQLVGAAREEVVGNVQQGRAYVFDGESGALARTLDTPDPQGNAFFGMAAAAGDVDGDTRADALIGAPGAQVAGNDSQGRAYLFDLDDGSLLRRLDTPNPQANGAFGRYVATGDANGDGKAEALVGAPTETAAGNSQQGRAYLFDGAGGSLLRTLNSPDPQVDAFFGSGLALGNVDSDPAWEVLVGAPGLDVGANADQGRAYLLDDDGSLLLPLDSPNPEAGGAFGVSVAIADTSGDGLGELVVGAWKEDVGGGQDRGRVYVFAVTGGLVRTLNTPNAQMGGSFGEPLSTADANGDGKKDVLVAAQFEMGSGSTTSGRAYLFDGGSGGLMLTLDAPDPQSNLRFGRALTLATGPADGRAQMLVGGPRADVGANFVQGRAYLFVRCAGEARDCDSDGYWDADETLKGSNTLAAASKPEHCDGVDNDGDTAIDEQPAAASWDIDGDTVKDCLDASVDSDGDGIVNTVDTDDDGDGRTDAQERKLSTDELGPCPAGASHDGWASDRDRDKDADIGDVIANFNGKIGNPANYDARSDADGDGDDDIGDVIQLYGMGRINTRCATFTFTNGTGAAVDDIHIVWSAAIAEVYVARDSALVGWSNRTISGGGTVLDMDRPDGSGDLAAGGTLTVVLRTATSTAPAATTCRWTLEGVDVGGC